VIIIGFATAIPLLGAIATAFALFASFLTVESSSKRTDFHFALCAGRLNIVDNGLPARDERTQR
jgi:hypothetical protein